MEIISFQNYEHIYLNHTWLDSAQKPLWIGHCHVCIGDHLKLRLQSLSDKTAQESKTSDYGSPNSLDLKKIVKICIINSLNILLALSRSIFDKIPCVKTVDSFNFEKQNYNIHIIETFDVLVFPPRCKYIWFINISVSISL